MIGLIYITMSNTRKTREIVTSIINRGLLNLEPTVPNINALHRAIMSVLDKNKDLSVNIQVDNDVMENIFVTALELIEWYIKNINKEKDI